MFAAAQYLFSVQAVHGQGDVRIIRDDRLNQLEEQYISAFQKNNAIDGYRIQIFFDSGTQSKRNASAARDRFKQKYPGAEAYLDFREPYYRVRVGDFRTRIEAEGFRIAILGDFPNAFTVADKVSAGMAD